jgi:polyferredoxin
MSAILRQAPRRQRLRKALVLLSFLLFPVTLNFLSPYLIVAGAAEGVITGSFLLFGALFIGSLFFGRLWCGWLCPGAGMAELAAPINTAAFKLGRAGWLKWLIWAPWIVLIAGLALQAGGYTRLNPLYMTESGFSLDEPVKFIVYFVVVGLFVGLAVAFGRRAGCHTVCWMAPFMIVGRGLRNRLGLPALQLITDPAACVKCTSCTSTCPMSLPVSALVQTGQIEHPECILCGTCADGCHKAAIRFRISRGRRQAQHEAA